MIKECTIAIAVSGDTSGNCDEALIEALDAIMFSMKESGVWTRNDDSYGNLDEGEEEVHWEYIIKTTGIE